MASPRAVQPTAFPHALAPRNFFACPSSTGFAPGELRLLPISEPGVDTAKTAYPPITLRKLCQLAFRHTGGALRAYYCIKTEAPRPIQRLRKLLFPLESSGINRESGRELAKCSHPFTRFNYKFTIDIRPDLWYGSACYLEQATIRQHSNSIKAGLYTDTGSSLLLSLCLNGSIRNVPLENLVALV